jgi:hypothetical protein
MKGWKLPLALALWIALWGCAKEGNPPPEPPFGPAAIAVGRDATTSDPLIALTDDMLNWTWVEVADSGITAGAALNRVFFVPESGRLVVVADVTGGHDEIWTNDARGTGTWTRADFGTSPTDESYLDAEHRNAATGGYEQWDLKDIFFVDASEGYAVGTHAIVLRTWDGGDTWHDMNAYFSDGSTVRIVLSSTSGDFEVGETVDGGTSGASGTVVSWDDFGQTLVVTGVGATAFQAGEDVTGQTSSAQGTAGAPSNTWLYDTQALYKVHVFADETAGTHTLWFGADGAGRLEGLWKLVSDNASGASRAFTWNPPTPALQGQFYGIDVHDVQFLDATTGALGSGNGVWTSTDGGAVWTQDPVYNSAAVKAVCYAADPETDGYFYAVDAPSATPIRLGVTWASGTGYTLDAGGWQAHGDAARVGISTYTDETDILFRSGDRLYFSESGWSFGPWGWCDTAGDSDFSTPYWQDTDAEFMGGAASGPANPAYQRGALQETGSPSGFIRDFCLR